MSFFDDLYEELIVDQQYEAEQAYWASSEGIARQLREFRERYGPHGMGGCDRDGCPHCCPGPAADVPEEPKR